MEVQELHPKQKSATRLKNEPAMAGGDALRGKIAIGVNFFASDEAWLYKKGI
jgi:hypothetical protein